MMNCRKEYPIKHAVSIGKMLHVANLAYLLIAPASMAGEISTHTLGTASRGGVDQIRHPPISRIVSPELQR
jgi:hypothetical protein